MFADAVQPASGMVGAGGGSVPMDYIARWDMNGDSADETGNYNITLYGGATQNADSVSYDGINDYGQCSRLAFNNNQFTIVQKFKAGPIDQSNGLWIACSRTTATGTRNEWEVAVYPPNFDDSLLFVVTNTAGASTIVEGPTITSGTVYTFAFRFTGGHVEIYDDTGALVAQAEFTGTMNTGSLHTRFAIQAWTSATVSSCGEMDQYRGVAYARALTASELPVVINKIKNGWQS